MGSLVGADFRRADGSGPRVRMTFRDIDPRPGTARQQVEPDGFGQPDAITVESGAITYLREPPGVGKMIVATRT